MNVYSANGMSPRILGCAVGLALSSTASVAAADSERHPTWCEVVHADESMVAVRTLRAGPTPGLLYLNRCLGGATFTGGSDDSRTNHSSIVQGQVQFPEFVYGEETWSQMLFETQEIFAPFNVVVTDVDPGEEPHNEMVVCGGPSLIDRAGIAGISPMRCRVLENSVSFTFPQALPDDARQIAEVVAHEAGHAFGLDHEAYCPDLMTYINNCGEKWFANYNAECGEYEPRGCSCPRFAQNSYEWLGMAFGFAEASPPDVSITAPADGEAVAEGFAVRADVTSEHGVEWVKLFIDYRERTALTNPPYEFSAPLDLGKGRHLIEVRAADRLGAEASAALAVNLGAACAGAGDCPDGEACVDGRCVRGPGVVGGLGEPCASTGECASALCLDDGSGQTVCVEICEPDSEGCPGDFNCVAAGALGAVCIGSTSDSGGCAITASQRRAPWLVLCALAALVIVRRRTWAVALGVLSMVAILAGGCGDGTPSLVECGGDSDVCGEFAHCAETPAGSYCVCDRGFEGDGIDCDLVPAAYRSIAAGEQHPCGLRTDGSLWCWGWNWYGQLGVGAADPDAHPLAERVPGEADWSAVSVGSAHTCGIREPGTLSCWGSNRRGQLGTADTENRDRPNAVGDGSDWVAVSAGSSHTCGIRAPGALWCWGQNRTGQLGTGDWVSSEEPMRVGEEDDWLSVSVGNGHTCGTRADGTLWCWGGNRYGQLGTGVQERIAPARVGTDSDWLGASCGRDYTCAIRAPGTLSCWGRDDFGQLGEVKEDAGGGLASLAGQSDWVAVGTGQYHTCGARADDSLWCWGSNGFGQLGNGTQGGSNTPAAVDGDERDDWSAIAVGVFHTCSIASDESLWCWGSNSSGVLGIGVTAERAVPERIGDGTWAFAATRGDAVGRSCGIQSDGTLWCWGANQGAILGDGTDLNRQLPVRVGDAGVWRSLAIGRSHACAIRDDGALWCWGGNGSGQLGNDSTVGQSMPVRIGADTDWETVDADDHTCGIRVDGTLWCWGENESGQVGDGNTLDVGPPTRVGDADDWAQVSTGKGTTCATRDDGTLWCWGEGYGQEPAQMTGDVDWAQASATQSTLCALRHDRSLWCSWTELGTFEQVGSDKWNDVGGDCAIRDDGSLWCGLLENAVTQVGDETDWAMLAKAGAHACALKSDASLYCWGDGAYGQLGHGDAWRARPAITLP